MTAEGVTGESSAALSFAAALSPTIDRERGRVAERARNERTCTKSQETARVLARNGRRW
jgi:hypothetical protein